MTAAHRTRLPITQIDAFADAAFTGNPAAVMPLDAWLDDDVLLAIAGENNLSETAFLVADASGAADYELRWFTPAAEVALCGHATIASGHYLLERDAALTRVTFRTRQAGILWVERDGEGYRMALPSWAPTPMQLPDIVAAIGAGPAVETLWYPTGYALIVLENAAQIRALKPDQRALAALGKLVAVVTAPGDTTDVISRVFTPYYDIAEDPVTGSAHAVMTPYWAARLGRDSFTAYQASARGGHVACRLDGDHVILGGRCITVMEGVFLL